MESTDWPLLGRQQEMERLEQLLSDGGALLIGGSAGAGKSRLLRAMADLAAERGFETETVRGSQAAGGVAFAPLVAMIPVSTSPELNATQLFRLILHELTRVSRLLVVDDAHLLDAASDAVLAAAVEQGALCVFGARTREFVKDSALHALQREGVLAEVTLPPLDRAAVEVLVRQVLGGEIDPAISDRIWRMSKGHPLFVHELLVGNIEAGTVVDDGRRWVLQPEIMPTATIEEAIDKRLSGLPPEHLDVLHLLAVHPSVGRSVLEELVGDAGLSELLRRHLVIEARSGRRRELTIGHPVYAEVLGRRSPSRHRRSHAMLADILEAQGARRRTDSVYVTSARLAAGAEVEPEQLIAAGYQALALTDYVLAGRMASHPSVAASAQGLTIAGHALIGQLRVEEAEERFEQALVLSAGDDAAQLHAELAQVAFQVHIDLERAKAHLREGRRLAEGPQAMTWIVLGEMTINFMVGWPLRTIRGRESLVAKTLPPIAKVNLAMVMASAYLTSGSLGACQQELASFRNLLAAAKAASWMDVERADFIDVVATGAIAPRDAIARGRMLADAVGRSSADASALLEVSLMHVSAIAGYFDELRSAGKRWQEKIAEASDRMSVQAGIAAWTMGLAEQADSRGVEELVAAQPELEVEMNNEVLMAVHPARMAAAAGDATKAVTTLERAAEQATHQGQFFFGAILANQLAVLDETKLAREWLQTCVDHADHRYIAFDWLDAVEAEIDQDQARLEELAISLGDRGFLLDAMRNTARAARLADKPLDRFRLRHMAEGYRQQTMGAVCPILSSIESPLTDREQELALAAASGVTNAALAEQLSTSRRTVENHLYRALNKLEASRDDLVEALSPQILRSEGAATTI